MTIAPVDIIKILLAVLIGGSIGFEREIRRKGAGLRTITIICIGSTIFTILSNRIDGTGRIAANIVTGIGFLGAGVILHENNRIKGLTTAADVWVSAALGMGLGAGYYAMSLIGTAIVLIVMIFFARFEQRVDRQLEIRQYQISLPCDPHKADQLEDQVRSCSLRLGSKTRMKVNGMLLCTWDISGSTKNHDSFVQLALVDPDIKQIEW
jgi:putative Mg2+ transporter-C (MgtC) family protein